MNSVDIALDFANVVNFVGLILLLSAVVKNRNVLRGFSVSGCFLTFLAICGFETAYFIMGNIVSFMLGLTATVFWFAAFAYSLRQMIRMTSIENKENRR